MFTSRVKRIDSELTFKFSILAIWLFSKTFSCEELLDFFSHADLFIDMMMQLIVNPGKFKGLTTQDSNSPSCQREDAKLGLALTL